MKLYSQNCGSCPIPVAVIESNITNHSVDLSWANNNNVSYYAIRYKESGNPSWTYTYQIFNNSFQLNSLQSNTLYEYQIQAYCASNYGYGYGYGYSYGYGYGYGLPFISGWSSSYFINTSNLIPDCNGVYGGSAYLDNCGSCVGGNTGNNACIQDCNGVYGGSAYLDNCGSCVGGNTNIIACFFNPYVDIEINNNNCDSLADLSITVSQTAFQTDMSLSNFLSDDGIFDFNNINIGDTIGSAYMNAAGGNIIINSLIIVNAIISPNEIVANAYDTTYNINVGAFTISNQQSLAPNPPGTSYNGISIIASSIVDGNNTTAGNFSNITFNNIFKNPSNNTNFNFISNITSEIGDFFTDTIQQNIICNTDYFSPEINVTGSDSLCNQIIDLTISSAQDNGEYDIATSLFFSDMGQFNFNNINIGDTIGYSYLNAAGGGININAVLIVNSVITNNEILVTAFDTIFNIMAGVFTMSNLNNGGVNIIATSPPDGNNTTSGNFGYAVFENMFITPGIDTTIQFVSITTSENGDVDYDTTIYNINCGQLNVINNVNEILCYPNPFNNYIKINTSEKYNHVNIYDLNGKYYTLLNYDNNTLNNLDYLKSGTYIISLEFKDKIIKQKMIKF